MKRVSEIIMLALLVFAAIIFISAIVSVFFDKSGGGISLPTQGNKIGLVEVKGVILNSEPIVKTISHYRNNSNIKALLVRIDSPGGGVAASQEIYEALRKTREAGKPVVASMSSVAASGGYYVALAADTIVANPGTTTGSIDVIMSFFDFSELLQKIGLRSNTIKSGRFKDAGTYLRPMTERERAYIQRFVDDAFSQFVDVVAKERGMEHQQVLKLADGRVFTGQQAYENGLVDRLGSYEDAVEMAATMAGITGKPDVIKPEKRKISIFDLLFNDVQETFQAINTWPVLRYQLVY